MSGTATQDPVTLIVGSSAWAGWTEIEITRGLEVVPSTFSVSLTETAPAVDQQGNALGKLATIDVEPGQACKVMIGSTLVITGVIEIVTPQITASAHTLTIQGRSLLRNIVDCEIDTPGASIGPSSVAGLATVLCQPYGVQVYAPDGDGLVLPITYLSTTDQPFQIIATAARYAQFLVYDDEQGRLVLAKLGTQSMASGFTLGQNIEAITVNLDITRRFSEYRACLVSTDFFTGGARNAADDSNRVATVTDTGMDHRVNTFISETAQGYGALATAEATWRMNRARGRSQAANIVVSTWRDSAGTLWEPNYLAPIAAQLAKIAPGTKWIIASVTYKRSLDTGTTAEVQLMPPESFATEPVSQALFAPAVYKALSADQAGPRP